MKKVILVLMVVGLVVGLGSRQAFAQDKKIEFSLNAGAMTFYGPELSFSYFAMTVSPQVDFHVTKGFMISPEAMFVTDFTFVGVLPGVIFNYSGKGFFAGVGAVLPVVIYEGLAVGVPFPKINIGYRARHINLTAYLITSFEAIFQAGLVGASIGYRF